MNLYASVYKFSPQGNNEDNHEDDDEDDELFCDMVNSYGHLDFIPLDNASNTKITEGLTFELPTPQNGQTHSDSLLAVANELFECVRPFCGVVAQRVRNIFFYRTHLVVAPCLYQVC